MILGDVHVDHPLVDPLVACSARPPKTRAARPTIAYSADGILVPPNLGQFDVHWTDATVNDVWQVTMANDYIDLHIYTVGLDPTLPNYTLFNPTEWYPIASTKEQLSLTVTGLQLENPATKGTAAAQHVMRGQAPWLHHHRHSRARRMRRSREPRTT